MRAIERVLAFFAPLFPTQLPNIPSWYSGRLWLFKLGYHKLLSAKVRSDEWIWIIDHATQWGSEKCFVVLGIKASEIPEDHSLSLSDVEVLMVEPVKESNGAIVMEQLKRLSLEIGVPISIVADAGPDIKSGIEQFCELTQGTVYLYDIKHLIANLLKAEFEKDETWNSFLDFMNKARKFLQQSTIAGLAPPSQRAKARFMNLEPIIYWALKILDHLDSEKHPETIDQEQLERKLGWLRFFRDDLHCWKRILDEGIAAEQIVRKEGYHTGITSKLHQYLMSLETCPRSINFQVKIITAIFQQERKLKSHDQFISSSEVLECLYGKFKYFEREQSKSGFTVSVLALPAMTGKTTETIIKNAMELTTVQEINNWGAENIGTSVQAQRVAWLGDKKAEQKRDEKPAA